MILITGATGFLGSRLLQSLLANGEEVVVAKRSFSDLTRIRGSLDHARLHLFDLDKEDADTVFKRFAVDIIVHAATEYGRQSTPVYTILDANLILPLRLAEVGMANGLQCFINTDSYFNKDNNSYSNLLNYSLSKKSLLTWLQQLSGSLKIVNVVLEHIYGPQDSETKFVESLIQQIAVRRVAAVPLTHGHQRRDFVYLDDVVSAYLKIIEFGRTHQFQFKTFEVGTGRSTQVRDFAEMAKALSNSPTHLDFGAIAYRRDEIMDSRADISELLELGWQPQISVDDGVGKVLQSYGLLSQ